MLRSTCTLLALAVCGYGQTRFEYWPGATYDPAIPTHRKVLGFDAGDRVSSHGQIIRYLEALAAAAPNRLKLFDYGRTWEGRRLVYALVGSESNVRKLGDIRKSMKKLADPRVTSPVEAGRIADTLPAVI